nr:tail fiber protein [Mucilaginibacter sp. L294]
MDPYIGEIRIVPFATPPNGWASCNGQKLPIRGNEALYTILGNTYGGDAEYFNLPDMRGRGPVGMGQGHGLAYYRLGQKAGAEKPTINDAQNAQNGVGVLRTNGIPDKDQQPTINGTHTIMQPALPLNFIISLKGKYPMRS